MPKAKRGFTNRIDRELKRAERSRSWLQRKLSENGVACSPMTIHSWARNQTQPSLGEAAEIAKILQVPIRRLLPDEQESEDQLFGQEFVNKLNQKFKKA